jgi:hypothetical protein
MHTVNVDQQAKDDFNKVRKQEVIQKLFTLLNPERHELLSFEEVRKLIKPRGESYRGMQVIPISKIVGSEGRYRDFSKAFLPRKDYMRGRWENIDRAHLRDVFLPPIKLYEVGGVYFVRDGNHRVSVGRSQGVEAIDAEVTSLSSHITLNSEMTKEDLKRAVIEYEKKCFYQAHTISDIVPPDELTFTATGRYDEVKEHILIHKYYLNENRKEEISFKEAVRSWYGNLFYPIIKTVEEENILTRFPGRTKADLYVWIIKHWDELKKKYGDDLSIQKAAVDFSEKYGKSLLRQFVDTIKNRIFSKKNRQ